jgi:hypothetical protein
MPLHSLRLRDGERELEVSGSQGFVRQVLDDLPALLSRLRSEAPGRPSSIRMPPPPAGTAEGTPDRFLDTASAPRRPAATNNGSVEDRVLGVLRDAARPLAVAAIRKRLGNDLTPQQVRRVLERAGSRVTVTGNRPATYRIAER